MLRVRPAAGRWRHPVATSAHCQLSSPSAFRNPPQNLVRDLCFPRAGSGKKWALGWIGGGSGGGQVEESKQSCMPDSSRYPEEHSTRGRPPNPRSTCLFGVGRCETRFPKEPGRQREEIRRETKKGGLADGFPELRS